jgi:hypothetical protein
VCRQPHHSEPKCWTLYLFDNSCYQPKIAYRISTLPCTLCCALALSSILVLLFHILLTRSTKSHQSLITWCMYQPRTLVLESDSTLSSVKPCVDQWKEQTWCNVIIFRWNCLYGRDQDFWSLST